MDKIYCDTCIYLDLFEGRKDKFRDLGEFALNVFRKIKEKQYKLIISDWVIDEFKKHHDVKQIEELLEDLKEENLVRVIRNKEDERKAKEISSTNFPDALHVVLAKKANAIYLITRNIQDFAEFQDLIEIKMPESL